MYAKVKVYCIHFTGIPSSANCLAVEPVYDGLGAFDVDAYAFYIIQAPQFQDDENRDGDEGGRPTYKGNSKTLINIITMVDFVFKRLEWLIKFINYTEFYLLHFYR